MGPISVGWAALAQVAGVSLAFALGIAVVFSLGVLGLSRAAAAKQHGAATTRYTALTAVAFVACAAGYGMYLLVPQFH